MSITKNKWCCDEYTLLKSYMRINLTKGICSMSFTIITVISVPLFNCSDLNPPIKNTFYKTLEGSFINITYYLLLLNVSDRYYVKIYI